MGLLSNSVRDGDQRVRVEEFDNKERIINQREGEQERERSNSFLFFVFW
jgi:hypothetical protein